MDCMQEFWGICLVTLTGTSSIFPFKDFISALALLVIIYTISDVRYHFRIAIAPVALYPITFALIIVIGFGTLLTDIWISEKWLVPKSLIGTAIWQGALATLFLGLLLTWMFYAFVRPAKFGPRNYKHYANALYRVILKGSDAELSIIAHELGYSAKELVDYASRLNRSQEASKNPSPESYAHDMFLLIANKKFCRHLLAGASGTVIMLLDAAAEAQREGRSVPIGLFAKNISDEAIRNTDSALYHEGEWYESGLLGHIKPFSKALYGHFRFVESLGHQSPLDIDYESRDSWTARQVKAYCRVVLMTFQNYLDERLWGQQCYTINGAIEDIQRIGSGSISDINKSPNDYVGDAWQRLRASVDFLNKMVGQIGKLNPVPKVRHLRLNEKDRYAQGDLYDLIAEAMFEVIHAAGYFEGTAGAAWSIHHNSVWGEFFERLGEHGKAMEIVQHKLRRLLWNEIKEFERFPNYKSARVLGVCLNVMGLKPHKRSDSGHRREYMALRVVLLPWVQKNYKKIRAANVEVADACLIGSITYDEKKSRLVKTWAKGLQQEPARDYLAV